VISDSVWIVGSSRSGKLILLSSSSVPGCRMILGHKQFPNRRQVQSLRDVSQRLNQRTSSFSVGCHDDNRRELADRMQQQQENILRQNATRFFFRMK